ncbi:MAG: YkgJ family cysteine cluster protein [Bacteroidales bacterium]|nr:YkgJ family cysteine cluster protein [Bacteroidales bacterium]
MELSELKLRAEQKKSDFKNLSVKLKKMNKRKLDDLVQNLHYYYFDKFDCLNCANCCRTLGPRLSSNDIDKMAKHLKMKSSAFSELYIRIDEDGDYIFKSMPCPFLGDDNYCAVYESRPKACREYPHTNQRNFYQILNLSLKNTETCPIVFEIFTEIENQIK